MALVVKDRVKVYSSTTGTGTLSLGSAFAGFQTFNNALGDGDTTYYGIFESSTGEWEVGLGTYTSSGNTLSRDTILESSNAGAAVNLTADTEVFITYPAEKSVYFDANGDVNLNRDPQSALQAATKQYVDTIAAAGIHYHDPVRVESPDTAGSLTATYDNGSSGVGATLTNSGTQAALVIDGVTVSTNDRVLIYNQTNGYENGVYTVTNTGSASTNWVLTRATDADSYGPSDPDSLGQGDAFFVKEGDTGAGELYVMNTAGEIVFGTTDINFIVVAETAVYSAGDGLTLSGTEFNVGPGTGITVNATTVSTVQDIATSATPEFNGLTTTGNITFGDNDKAIFGAGSDLQIYHDGSHSYISDQGTGGLKVLNDSWFYIKNAAETADKAIFKTGAEVELYYNGNQKFETTSTGVDITGTLTSDGLTVDTDTLYVDSTNNRVGIGTLAPTQRVQIGEIQGKTFVIDQSVSNTTRLANDYSAILEAGGGYDLKLRSNGNASFGSIVFETAGTTDRMKIASNGDISFYEDTGTNVNFFWDASTMALGIGTGTTTPVNPLTIQQTSVHWPYIALTNTSGTTKSQFGYQVGDDLLDIAANSGGIKFRTNNTETMRLTSAGKLGVNVQTPDGRLEVQQAQNSATAGSFSGPHLRLNNSATTDTTGFTGIAYSGSTVDNYGWTSGVQRTSTNGTEVDFIWRHHSNSDTGTEAMRIHSSGHVTVNTTSDNNAMLEVLQDTDGYSRGLRSSSQSNATTYAALAMVNGTDAALTAGSSSSVNTNLTFYTATGGTETEAMRIDSSGNLLVGTTSNIANVDSSSGEGIALSSGSYGGFIGASRASDIVAILNRQTSDGDILLFRKDGTNVGSIGTAFGYMHLGEGVTGLGFRGADNTIYPYNVSTSTARDGAIKLGSSSYRFADLYLSGQANVPKIDMYQQTNAHVFSVASYQNVYGPPSGGWNSGTIAHTFNSHDGTAIAQLGIGGSSVNLTSRFFGDVSISGASAPETHAYLNIGSSGSGQTRAIDIDGGWSANESKAISFTYGTGSANLVGQWDVQHNGPESRMRWGKLYHSADSSTYTMELVSTSTTTADLYVNGGKVWHQNNDGSGSGLDADTVDSLHASRLGPTYEILNTGTTAQWVKLGNFAAGQSGKSCTINVVSNSGYNASDAQNSQVLIRFKTSNNSSNQSGFYGDVQAYKTGPNASPSIVRVVQVSTTSFDIWCYFATYTGDGSFYTVHQTDGTWTHSNSSGTPSGTYIDATINTMWHSGNDGTGSGLDADTVDGIQASSFLRSDASDSYTGILTGGELAQGLHPIHSGYYGLWNTEAYASNSSNYMIINAGTDTYITGNDTVYIRGGDNNSTNQLAVTTSGSTIGGNTIFHQGNLIEGTSFSGTYPVLFGIDETTGRVFENSNITFNGTTNTLALPVLDVSSNIQIGAEVILQESTDRADLLQITSTTSGWGGLQIRNSSNEGRWSFMTDGNQAGIYDDENGDWHIYMIENAGVTLYYNNSSKLATTSGGAAVTGALTATGDITAYFSDERLKDFDGKIEGALDKVSQLNGYYYHENDKAKELGFENDARQVGVSAQEVEAVLPEVIKPAPVDPEYKTVQYEKLVPLLIEAIKELKEEVRQLKEDKA